MDLVIAGVIGQMLALFALALLLAAGSDQALTIRIRANGRRDLWPQDRDNRRVLIRAIVAVFIASSALVVTGVARL